MSLLRKSRAKVPTVWTPRIKDANEAQPYRIDMRGTEGVPTLHNPGQPMRPGAMDAFKYQSRGF